VSSDSSASQPAGLSDEELARSLGDFTSEHAELSGARLHYVTGGQGQPLVLLPGWPETWWEYRKVMPALASRFRVFAVDLRGMGSSSKPASGFSKRSMARDIHEFVTHFGYDEVNVAGHGIGAMVAFAYAANHPEATSRVAILNTTHVDDSYYEFPMLPRPGDVGPHRWWLAFHQVPGLPEKLLSGQSRLIIDYMFELSLVHPDAVTSLDRDVYARAYDAPDAYRAAQGWFQSYVEDIEDFNGYGKIQAPMLGLAYGPFFDYMKQVLPDQGVDVRVAEVEGSRNYLVEEQPQAVVDAFFEFFG
jgi:pimeloyl-ACP methyl ester carboxylesterase